jgi:hypothetical protein
VSIFNPPKAPAPPPPPANAPQLASPSIAEQGAAERATLSAAQGAGFNGQDKTGGQGAAPPGTTASNGAPQKSLLGG